MVTLTAVRRGSLNREDAKNTKSSHQGSPFASFAPWSLTPEQLRIFEDVVSADGAALDVCGDWRTFRHLGRCGREGELTANC